MPALPLTTGQQQQPGAEPGATPLPVCRSTLLGSPGAPTGHSGSGRGSSRGALLDAWADLLSPGRFDWFTTHTFRHNVSQETAAEAWHDWARWVRDKQGHRAEWFRVTERTKAGAVHYHALVGRCSAVRRLSALDYWRNHYGYGQVLQFKTGLGAHYYLSKYVSKDADGELLCEFSRRFKLLFGRFSLARETCNAVGVTTCVKTPKAAEPDVCAQPTRRLSHSPAA